MVVKQHACRQAAKRTKVTRCASVPASGEQRARQACEVHGFPVPQIPAPSALADQRGVSSLFALSDEPPIFSPVRRNASPVLRPALPIA